MPVASAKASVKIYPNPATNQLQVSVKDEIAANSSLKIIDAKGVVVMEQRMQRNPQPVNVSKLTPGFYLVKINNNGNIITEKFIKE
ncbi:MAG: T9SS type A sorting domain-containing protein [Ferruginibacter sp.]